MSDANTGWLTPRRSRVARTLRGEYAAGVGGSSTVRTVCRYGFDTMRLHKVSLTVVAGNEGARRAYEKVGFVEEGRLRSVFRRDGAWHDKLTMGLLEGELRS